MLYILCILGGATFGVVAMAIIQGSRKRPCDDCILYQRAVDRINKRAEKPKAKQKAYEEDQEEMGFESAWDNLPKYENIHRQHK